MKKSTYKNRIIILIGILIGFGILYQLGFTRYFSVEYLTFYADHAHGFVETQYTKAVVGYIMLLALLVALSMPVGILIPIIGGFLFGWLPGALYANIGATIGATISFLMAHYFIGEYIQEHFAHRLQRFNQEFEQYGYLYLLGLHFFPITPFFILNIIAGATNISLWTFFWTTTVGVTPAYLIYSYIGNQLTSIYEFNAAVSTKIFIAFIVLKLLSLLTLLIGRFGRFKTKNSS